MGVGGRVVQKLQSSCFSGHFQSGGVCLRFFVCLFLHRLPKSKFKMISIFSEISPSFFDIVQSIKDGVVRLPYIIQLDLLPYSLDRTKWVIIAGSDICLGFL